MSDYGRVVVGRETFWDTLPGLVRDPIVDVRIRVARLLVLISGQYRQPHLSSLWLTLAVLLDKFGPTDTNVAVGTLAFAQELVTDGSHEVQAFAAAVLASASMAGLEPSRPPVAMLPPLIGNTATTFSRPPPVPS